MGIHDSSRASARSVAALERYKSREALALMRTLKRALDPNGIMNPGKMLRSQ